MPVPPLRIGVLTSHDHLGFGHAKWILFRQRESPFNACTAKSTKRLGNFLRHFGVRDMLMDALWAGVYPVIKPGVLIIAGETVQIPVNRDFDSQDFFQRRRHEHLWCFRADGVGLLGAVAKFEYGDNDQKYRKY